jgi:hypothetical protein
VIQKWPRKCKSGLIPKQIIWKSSSGKPVILCDRQSMTPLWSVWVEQGHVLGFSVLGVIRFRKDQPLEVELVARE